MIHRAFFADESLATPVNPGGTGHWSQRRAPAEFTTADGGGEGGKPSAPYGRLLGRRVHSLVPVRAGGQPVVYVVRDGRDVAISMHQWAKLRRPARADQSLADYLRSRVDWAGSPGRRVRPKYLLWEHWRRHVSVWIRRADVVIRQELLLADPMGEMRKVGRVLEREPEQVEAGPRVGWNPSPHVGSSRWRDVLSESDLKLFDRLVPPKFVGRFEN